MGQFLPNAIMPNHWNFVSFYIYISSQLFILCQVLQLCTVSDAQYDPHFKDKRTTIVQLFEWPWTDIKKECENFLGPNNFGGVQVSPPTENVIALREREHERWYERYQRPWWERYHPLSYKLDTRSGTLDDFESMVKGCNGVGVRVYVDVVLNHMSGYFVPSNGTTSTTKAFPGNLTFPELYSNEDFSGPLYCSSDSGFIEDQRDVQQIKQCRVDGTNDLNQGRENVQMKQRELLQKLLGMGVAGFRVAYARYMWPDDLKAIYTGLTMKEGEFGKDATPFFYHEVEDLRTGTAKDNVNATDYFPIGRVTEFKLVPLIGRIIRRNGSSSNGAAYTLAQIRAIGNLRGWIPSPFAVVFVDDHEKQRIYGAYNFTEINFRYKRLYIIATAVILAINYGIPRIMSSYKWTPFIREGVDVRSWEGPPHDENYTVSHPDPKEDGCEYDDKVDPSEWVCEHRWKTIKEMVKFRNFVNGTIITDFDYHGTKDQIAFSRTDEATKVGKGFFALNNEDYTYNDTVKTTLKDKMYTDLISNQQIEVKNGMITLNIQNRHDGDVKEYPFIAIIDEGG